MPDLFLDASVQLVDEATNVLLLPFGEGAKVLQVRFTAVLAYAVYDDFTFALSDITCGPLPSATSIVRNYDWPAPHKRYEEAGFADVTCYRFGTQNAIV